MYQLNNIFSNEYTWIYCISLTVTVYYTKHEFKMEKSLQWYLKKWNNIFWLVKDPSMVYEQ